MGQATIAWAGALVAAGHDARILVFDRAERRSQPAEIPVERITFSASGSPADLQFDVPRYREGDAGARGMAFDELNDAQLTRYRELFRRRLDTLIDRFNPDVLHVQYIGLLGQLALETGAPYVISSWGPELADLGRDARLQDLAEQAATNAGRILTADEDLAQRVTETFEVEPQRVQVAARVLDVSGTQQAAPQMAEELLRVYQALLEERFGGAR